MALIEDVAITCRLKIYHELDCHMTRQISITLPVGISLSSILTHNIRWS